MVLISRNILKYLKRGFTFGKYIRSHPYIWDDNGPAEISSLRQIIPWYSNMILVFFHYLFILGRAAQVNMSPNYSVPLKLYMRFTIVFYIFPPIFHLTIIFKRRQLLNFVKTYLEMVRMIEERYGLEGSPFMQKLCHLFMTFTYYGFNSITGLMLLATIIRPHSPEFISSVFPNPKSMSIPTRLLFSSFQMFYEFGYHSNAFLLIFTFVGFNIVILIVIKALRSITSVSHKATNDLIHVYRCVQISLKLYQEVYMTFILSTSKVVLICFSVFCTYGSIRMEHIMALTLAVIGVTCTSFLAGIFLYLAEVHQSTRKLVLSLNDHKRGSYMRKCVRGLPVLKIKIRSWYSVDKRMVLTMYKIIFDSSINFLMANQSS